MLILFEFCQIQEPIPLSSKIQNSGFSNLQTLRQINVFLPPTWIMYGWAGKALRSFFLYDVFHRRTRMIFLLNTRAILRRREIECNVVHFFRKKIPFM